MGRANKTSKKAHSHVHGRSYFGEFDGNVVVDWLNSKRRPQGDPIEKLIELNVGRPFKSIEEDVDTYLRRLIRRSKFALAPLIKSAVPGHWEIAWNSVGDMDHDQSLALVKLLHLANEGLIGRVRRCARKECGTWFYAKFDHMRFHSKTCQESTFKSSPEWREARRSYMRRERHNQKQRMKRQLELSKRKAGKP
jgi:hypothetical protein